jgi:hypothetical protein
MTSPLVMPRAFPIGVLAASHRSLRPIYRRACGLGLLVAAAVHVAVGFEHFGSSFGTASFLAGAGQAMLGAAVLLGSSALALQAVIVLNLMLVQLYVLNVIVGLPPAIAHSHLGGTHTVFGLTLAWPGDIDAQGVVAQASQLASALCAVLLGRRRGPR